jgi:hypothetical protein
MIVNAIIAFLRNSKATDIVVVGAATIARTEVKGWIIVA